MALMRRKLIDGGIGGNIQLLCVLTERDTRRTRANDAIVRLAFVIVLEQEEYFEQATDRDRSHVKSTM
jgi:hypothetical protein